MSGIVGIVNLDGAPVDDQLLTRLQGFSDNHVLVLETFLRGNSQEGIETSADAEHQQPDAIAGDLRNSVFLKRF